MEPASSKWLVVLVERGGWLAGFCCILLGLLRIAADGAESTVARVLFIAAAFFLAVPLLAKRGFGQAAGWLLPLTGTGSMLTMAFVEGGVFSEACVWLPLVSFVALLSAGIRGAIVVTAASWLGISVLAFMHLSANRFETTTAHLVVLQTGSVIGAVGFSTAIGLIYKRLRVQVEDSLKHIASTHPVTGLASRRAFHQLIKRSLNKEEPFGLLYIDLDDFKKINDSFGHLIGDDVLQVIGRRLQSVTRENENAFHLSGDEFAIVVKCYREEELKLTQQRFQQALRKSVLIDDTNIQIGASVGYSVATPGESARDVISRADRAMYDQKKRTSGFRTLKPDPVRSKSN